MKVVHISHEDHGGAGSAAYRLHTGLRSIGVDSQFLTAAKAMDDASVILVPPADDAPVETDSGLRNPEFGAARSAWKELVEQYPNRTRGLEMFSSPISTLPGMEQAIAPDADILHFHWICGLVPFDVPHAWLKRVPVVWTLHDMNPFTGGCHFSFGCRKFTKACGNCFQLGEAGENDHSRRIHEQKKESYQGLSITCVSPSRWMQGLASQSSLMENMQHQIVHNGIDLDLFRPRMNARARSNLFAKGDFVILFGSATGSKRKGSAHLDKAVRILRAKELPERTRLVSFGVASPADLGDLGQHATHLGFIDSETDMADLFSLADVFVVPSLDDNLPNSVSEALACGTPVVAFGVGGLAEQVEHGVTGYLAQPGDDHDLAAGIRWAMTRQEQKSLWAETTQACRQAATARFDHLDRARDMQTLYADVLSSNATATTQE